MNLYEFLKHPLPRWGFHSVYVYGSDPYTRHFVLFEGGFG